MADNVVRLTISKSKTVLKIELQILLRGLVGERLLDCNHVRHSIDSEGSRRDTQAVVAGDLRFVSDLEK